MANIQSDDPFLEVQSDVQQTLSQTRTLFSSYLRIRTIASSPTSPELAQSRNELESNLTTLSADLAELLESIAAVESDPYRFGLDVAEVQRRRGFVRDVGDEVEGMRQELVGVAETNIAAGTGSDDRHGNKGSGERGRKSTRTTKLTAPSSFVDSDDDQENEDSYAVFEHQQQQTMMREQDQQLDGVFQTVGVLRNQAEDMGRELEEQGGMLDEVDKIADRVGGKLNVGVKKVAEVIRKNEDSVSSCCIAVLIVVLIILLILVIVI